MDVADLVARFSAEGDERVIRALGQVDAGVTRVADNSTRAGRGLGTVFQVAGGFLAAQAVTGIFRLADGLIDAQTRAEQAKISLEVVTGSAEEAAAVFERIQKFAAATPFEMGDLLDATIQLEAFGLKSEDWLTTIGDTASAMSKSVDQVTQAVLDATSGQYERLKELGIQARVEGDKLTFSYMKNGQQITETVDKNNKEVIASTIRGIWNEKYAGAMEKQSKTFGGQMSTLKDNINLAMQSATAGVFQFATKGLGFINDIFANGFVDTVRGTFGDGVADFLGNIGDMASGIVDAFGEGTPVKDILDTLPESWRNIAEPVLKAADAFGQLVTNISQSDWDAVLDDLQQLAQAGLDLGTVVIGAAFKLATDTVSDIWDWFKDAIGVGRVASGDGTGGPDSDRTISVGTAIVDATLALGGALHELATDAASWIRQNLHIVGDQVIQIGKVILEGDVEIRDQPSEERGRTFAERFVDGVQSTVDAIQRAGRWIAETLFYGIGASIGLLAGLAVTVVGSFIAAIVAAFRNPSAIGDASRAFTEFFVSQIRFTGELVLSVARRFYEGLADAFLMSTPDALTSAIADGVRNAINGVGDWTVMLAMQGYALIMGLKDGVAFAYTSLLVPALQEIALGILMTFITAGSWLVQNGEDLIQGLWSGADTIWTELSAWLEDLPGEIVTYVGYLGDLLFQAGADAIQGLINGALSRVPGLQAAVDTAKSIWNQIPLLGNSPWPMMIDAGRDAMDGLILGAQSRMPALQRTVDGAAGAFSVPPGITPGLSPARLAAASGAGGAPVVYDLRGAFVGRGAEAEIRNIIAQQGATVIDRRLGSAQLAGARR